jgi:aspartate kinase
MAIVVQKYGGTSLADPDRIAHCASRAVAAYEQGHHVVVVVSAMGHTTDQLLELAGKVTDRPRQRELDILLATGEQASTALMAMAIHNHGVDAVSFAGHHLGIITDPVHCKAKIRSIDVDRIHFELDASRIVVAAGFQGVSIDGQITTLGRGGSDTTAVALAAALGTSIAPATCEIYTDVHGVFTADPRKVASARKLDRISYEEMLELASLGAGVMHSRAVMFGRNYNVPIHVRHSASPEPGTMIIEETPDMEHVSVVGCALTPDLGRVSLRKIPNQPGVEATIFKHIAAADVLVDDIMQIEYGDNVDISFTVDFQDLAEIKPAAQHALEELGRGEMAVEVGLAKVSVVGVGMRTHTGVAATMFKALAEADINIANITTSEIKISCIVAREHGEQALRTVHDAFGLSHDAGQASSTPPEARASKHTTHA